VKTREQGWRPPQHQHKQPMTARHRRRIRELHAAGESIRAIARKLNRHPETVRRILTAEKAATVTIDGAAVSSGDTLVE
jgi:DNA-binding NarL/FixJ family response regulator